MTAQTRNPHRDHARLVKAVKIADWFDSAAPEFVTLALEDDGKILRALDPDFWKTLAKLIDIHPPSAETVDEVLDLLKRRRETKADPFAGLGQAPEPRSVAR